jgi:hypothetical protein
MSADDEDLQVTLNRIRHFEAQLAHLRRVENNQDNYRLAASGFQAEIDRMRAVVWAQEPGLA